MKRRFVIFLPAALLLLPSILTAQEWTRFRGPNGAGVSDATTIPTKWTEKDYNWKIKIPGVGYSSPVLWGDRLFLTSGDLKSGERIVVCVDVRAGKIAWNKRFPAETHRKHKRNSYATATPVVDEKHLYVTWATPEEFSVMALDHQEKIVWRKDLGDFQGKHGHGVSPILFDGLLILANEQDQRGSLIALDKLTGNQRWQVPRNGKNLTYSTPCVFQRNGAPAEIIFTNWQHGITSINPKTGKLNWELSVFEPEKKERAIASPIIAGDLVIGTCGFVTAQKHFVAVRPADAQKKSVAREVWRMEKQVSYLPTPVVKGNRIYLCSERGVASCLNADTGKVVWQDRIDGEFYASPIRVGDKIFCTATNGEVYVFAADEKFRIIARNDLGEFVQATPAVASGRIYFRTQNHLISLGGKK